MGSRLCYCCSYNSEHAVNEISKVVDIIVNSFGRVVEILENRPRHETMIFENLGFICGEVNCGSLILIEKIDGMYREEKEACEWLLMDLKNAYSSVLIK